MSTTPTPIDISHLPDLKRLAQEAKKTGRPYLLRENSRDVALLTPVDTERKQQTNRQAIEATLLPRRLNLNVRLSALTYLFPFAINPQPILTSC